MSSSDSLNKKEPVNMQNSMLEYSKEVLQKVSFDPELFQKELKKALNMLVEDEKRELIRWIQLKFNYQHPGVIANSL